MTSKNTRPSPTHAAKEKSRVSKDQWREFTKTVWSIANTTSPKHPAVFPIEIPERLIRLFTFVDEIVLDPFAGVGTTASAAVGLGRRAVCVEENRSYVAEIRRIASLSNDGNGHADTVRVIRGDCRNLDALEDASISLVVTSPPYWNKASYGDGKANIGGIAQYTKFLREIRPAFAECYRVLQPGRKMCIVTANVNQFTDHGLLTFPLAADFTVILREIGFVMINEVIWSKNGTGGKWGSSGAQRPIFGSYPYPPNFLFKNVHEYVLIFAKPPALPVKSPKALSYKSLME